jgi:single-stranded-DNA-specific exonuclease
VKRSVLRRAASGTLDWPTALPAVLRRVYARRALASADELDLRLERLLPLSSLASATPAIERLLAAHARGERVLVVGDFDADGATSTALVVRQLRRLGFVEPGYVVPDRFRFGYGLSPPIVRLAAERRPQLLVTVDNGVASLEGVAEANRLGIDVVVTDHHLPGAELPAAAAIVNPNLSGEPFESKALAGVGVAFYVMAALTHRMRALGHPAAASANPAELLDLVALGTVADLVPLDFNNRILVAHGLKRIRAGRCVPGLRALLEIAGRKLASLAASDLGFQAGPRLNAAGRLEDMGEGIACLLTDDPQEARARAERLDRLNRDRREVEAKMQGEALEQLQAQLLATEAQLPAGLALFDPGWHQGVVGLVASRLKDRVHRPVIAFAPGEPGWLKGSARSVPGVHIRDVLDALVKREPRLIERFGGHAMAAGLTIAQDRFGDFARCFAAEVARWVDPASLRGELYTDGELQPGEFGVETAVALRDAGPWGAAFPEPCFDGRFGVLETRTLGERHLKLRLRAGSGELVDAIAFRHFDEPAALAVRPQDTLGLVYRTAVDEYSGARRMQLIVEFLAGGDDFLPGVSNPRPAVRP